MWIFSSQSTCNEKFRLRVEEFFGCFWIFFHAWKILKKLQKYFVSFGTDEHLILTVMKYQSDTFDLSSAQRLGNESKNSIQRRSFVFVLDHDYIWKQSPGHHCDSFRSRWNNEQSWRLDVNFRFRIVAAWGWNFFN